MAGRPSLALPLCALNAQLSRVFANSILSLTAPLPFQTYSAILTPNWISHVFTGPLVGGEQPVEASWDIQGLQEREGYEARVQAKNRWEIGNFS